MSASHTPKKKGQPEQVAPIPLDSLPADVRNIVQALPKEKQVEAIRIFARISITSSHSGPIPSPEKLEKYDDVLPGAADRIIKMAEKQQLHRFSLEESSIRRQFNQSGTGQWLAALIALAFLAGSIYLGINDHDWLAGVLGGATIISLVTVFITGKKHIARSLKEKE